MRQLEVVLGATFSGGVTYDLQTQLGILVEDLGQVVKRQFGIVVQLGFILLELSGIELTLNFLNLLYVYGVAYNDLFFDDFFFDADFTLW